jgi:hypothetical protein
MMRCACLGSIVPDLPLVLLNVRARMLLGMVDSMAQASPSCDSSSSMQGRGWLLPTSCPTAYALTTLLQLLHALMMLQSLA